jgi:hypothetical protein
MIFWHCILLSRTQKAKLGCERNCLSIAQPMQCNYTAMLYIHTISVCGEWVTDYWVMSGEDSERTDSGLFYIHQVHVLDLHAEIDLHSAGWL